MSTELCFLKSKETMGIDINPFPNKECSLIEVSPWLQDVQRVLENTRFSNAVFDRIMSMGTLC